MKKKAFLVSILTILFSLLILMIDNTGAVPSSSLFFPLMVIPESLSPPASTPTQHATHTQTSIPSPISSLDVRVSGSENDAEESELGAMRLNSKDLELVYGDSNQEVGIRFHQLTIPKHAIITNAYVQFQVDELSTHDTRLEISAEASGNAQPFTLIQRDISSRSVTTASVEWVPVPWELVGEAGFDQQTPDISKPVQEVINQSAWESGNSIVLIITGNGKRVAESFDGDPQAAPLLHVEWVGDGIETQTQAATFTPTTTASQTEKPTGTSTPTQTNTSKPPAASATATQVPSSEPTETYTVTPSETATATQIVKPTATKTISPAPSSTVTATIYPSPTTTPTFSATSTPTFTETITPTISHSPTQQITPTSTVSPTPIPSFSIYETIELTLFGPQMNGMGFPNPFLIEVDAIFSGPSGRSFVVPGYYDGDGSGGLDGNIWKVRFSPDLPGVWTFTTSSSEYLLDGQIGAISVNDKPSCSPYQGVGMVDLQCVGRLEYVGEHYLKFQNGPYWLKGGEDDPEDFLAQGVNAGFSSKYSAIDYLASKGINSLYLLLNNIGGDGNNVWPWVGSNSFEAQSNHERFNLQKLAEWENLFSYLQENGIILHLLFEDDSGWTGFNRNLYYRQIIARFSHHNGIIWNISEEYDENYSANQIKTFAQMIQDLDPYDHPITVHHSGSTDNWRPFLGDERFDLTSFQTEKTPVNLVAVDWFEDVESSGRTIPVSFDETGKIGIGDQMLARHIVWSAYLGGANFELHTFPLNSYLDFSQHMSDMTRARLFLEEHPFWNMRPRNDKLISGNGYVFADIGEVYIVYLPTNDPFVLDLSDIHQPFECIWFNPRDGTRQVHAVFESGSITSFTPPSDQDWVLVANLIQ